MVYRICSVIYLFRIKGHQTNNFIALDMVKKTVLEQQNLFDRSIVLLQCFFNVERETWFEMSFMIAFQVFVCAFCT